MAGVPGHRRIAARYRAPRWPAHLVPAQAIPAASRCRRPAVASIISALRPGGWMPAEDPDFVTPYASETDVVTRVVTQRCATGNRQRRHGQPVRTQAPRRPGRHDLVDVRTEDRARQVQGGSPPPERQAALHREKVAGRLLRRRHRGRASRHVSSSPGPRFHHLRRHERRILGAPGSLTLGNQADSAAGSLGSAIRARKEQSAANCGRHIDRRIRRLARRSLRYVR